MGVIGEFQTWHLFFSHLFHDIQSRGDEAAGGHWLEL